MKKGRIFGTVGMFVTAVVLFGAAAGCRQETAKTDTKSIRVEDLRHVTMNPSEVVFEGSEDSQSYWNVFRHETAAGKDGYYYMFEDSQGRVLEYMNAQTGKRVILCNRPQCEHKTADCPAFFGTYSDYARAVWCYRDHLYFIKYHMGKMVLVQTDMQASARKELFEIGNAQEDYSEVYNLVFSNDNVYIYCRTGNCSTIAIGDTMQIKIRKRSLDGKTDEYIITSDEERSIFDALKAYGGNVFFVYTHTTFDYETRVTTTIGEGLFCYNEKTGTVNKLLDKEVCDYSVDEKNKILYYYVINEGLYRYELETGEDRLIYPSERNSTLCQVSCDENYVYLDNGRWVAFTGTGMLGVGGDPTLSRKLWILDREGTELHCLDNHGTGYASYFGDGRCILTEMNLLMTGDYGPSRREQIVLKYILKSDIPSETLEWRDTKWE